MGSATICELGGANSSLRTHRKLLSSLDRKRSACSHAGPAMRCSALCLVLEMTSRCSSLVIFTQSSVSSSEQAVHPRKEKSGILAPFLCSHPLLTSWGRTWPFGTMDPRPTLLRKSLFRIKRFMILWKTPALVDKLWVTLFKQCWADPGLHNKHELRCLCWQLGFPFFCHRLYRPVMFKSKYIVSLLSIVLCWFFFLWLFILYYCWVNTKNK